MPADEVFIDHIKMPKIKDEAPNPAKGIWSGLSFVKYREWEHGPDDKMQEAILSKIKQKLPFDSDDVMVRYVPAEDDNVLVIAVQREKIDRHLAIYEKANLQIKSIGIWPMALANSYVSFFGRRKIDIEAIVMLLDMGANYTNVVICRHKDLLFARSIPMGAKLLESTCQPDEGQGPRTSEVINRLVLELNGCRRQFSSMHRRAQIERLIFLSGSRLAGMDSRDIYTTIAKQLEMPAQMGDCLAAVEMTDPYGSGIDRRQCQFSWAVAFGLSLWAPVLQGTTFCGNRKMGLYHSKEKRVG
ncbi:unnamed protein product [marine sediment metagenome]|uniref:SHS2 domain-containing protein n=1 Tax=marine sediment metagenome TaxID=412755 RepID=X0TVR2_9ZZZZ